MDDDALQTADGIMTVPCCGAMPGKAHGSDAAYDIESSEDAFLAPGKFKTITLDMRVMIPEGWVGLLFGRSGMGADGIGMVNGVGVIDAGYRGPLRATLFNHSTSGYKICSGDRVAQLLLLEMPKYRLDAVGMDEYRRLSNGHKIDSRGEGGLGSTGR